MAERPPKDGDDIWSEVLEQVSDALDAADLGEGSTRDALLDGVRQALEGVGTTLDLELEVLTQAMAQESDPSVALVEGGRSDADPRTPGEKPDLRVADLQDLETDHGEKDTGSVRPILTQVKVLQTPPRITTHAEAVPGLGQAGWIQVSGVGGADAAWQTLYQGSRSRLYRIGCTQGLLDITLEGAQIERLRAGQSIDVEGCLVRVSAVDEGSGRGGYAWINAPEREE